MGYFTGKTAIVTGAGSGIGYSLGKSLAENGATVVLADINGTNAEALARQLETSGLRAEPVQYNVADASAVEKVVLATVAKHGQLDYIFNNAGIAVGGEVRDCTLEDWCNVLDVNLYGVINGISAAYPVMVDQGFGHIVNTASLEGLVPFAGTVSYVASKYGVVGISNALRVEGADLGVKVSVVCPGYIKTAIFECSKMINLNREKLLEDMKKLPGVTPDECARVILNGVKRNKAIITVTKLARFMWWLHRLNPSLMIWLQTLHLRKSRKDLRTVA